MLGSKCIKGAANQSGILARSNFRPHDIAKKITATYNGKTEHLHITAYQQYPQVEPLPLPPNIDPTEITRFSPQRARDIHSTGILAQHTTSPYQKIDITLDNSGTGRGGSGAAASVLATSIDPRVDSYDCFGAVSLNSSMQSNVPSPFGGLHKFTHLNMPGGQWSQESKFMSNDLNSSHYINLRRELRRKWSSNLLADAADNNDGRKVASILKDGSNTVDGTVPF